MTQRKIWRHLPTSAAVISLPAIVFALNASATGGFTGVATANPKKPGVSAPNVLTPELYEAIVAQGSIPLDGGTASVPAYGYDGDLATFLPLAGAVQSPGNNVEATKTEPDKNTYLVLGNQTGPDASYDYGRTFLYQGHEVGVKNPATGQQTGYITRINLQGDGAHRVTLLATTDVNGAALPVFDGSVWDPFAARLLFSCEGGTSGGVWQATPNYPSAVQDLLGVIGRGGFEGMQIDNLGNVWIVEDVGGSSGAVNSHAKQPNSFVYRLVPKNKFDLTQGGVLQVLQVMSLANPGQPIAFHAGQADADILSQDEADLHTYGKSFQTNWVTIHDTDLNGFTPFDANALAKAALGTPFKRPENGQFRPATGFTEFLFDETGDTNLSTEAGSQFGGFGGVMRLVQTSASASTGTLNPVYVGDAAHTGFDNCAFWDADRIVFVEDAGDGLHTSRNAFDSAYLVDLTVDYGNPLTPAPTRILALGRDPSATIDSSLGSVSGTGFQNEGDNEITGFHVSDGNARIQGLLGTKVPTPFKSGWRVFYTQQHGDNVTWEILATP